MTTAATVRSARGARLTGLIDTAAFRDLFVDELGWSNADRGPATFAVEGETYTLTPVASYKGMRIWHCPQLPKRGVQRTLDELIGKENAERLVIFTDTLRQEWRWPRRGQATGANAALVNHQHVVGVANPDLLGRLHAIEIGIEEDPSLVEVLARMRAAFNAESESAAVHASKLMGDLYEQLHSAHIDERTATLLLARILFLCFADDTSMWHSKPDLFKTFLVEHTTAGTLHTDLTGLFDVLDTADRDRHLPAESPYRVFRYVNGGLFRDALALPALPSAFRDQLLRVCNFDWGAISPAVFGSMFQTVRDDDARRAGGEHYTTEANILKTIGPLFLDDLNNRLEAAWDDKAQLTRFLNDLGKIRVLDPACGCGNFLVVAYRELRALELRALIRRRDLDIETGIHTGGVNRSQMTLDVTEHVQVTLDHFYGIEIDAWPARIAGTAMLLVDHLANQNMEDEFGSAPDRLPIKIAADIHNRNALRIDWATVVPPSDDLIIVGNPPFIGMAWMNTEQQDDNRAVFADLGLSGLRTGRMDYVACWYAKAMSLLSGTKGRAAFVSTNSLTQGEQARTMVPLLERYGFKVDFGHRSFRWKSEAADPAGVHVVVVGFSPTTLRRPRRLFDYVHVDAHPVESTPAQLNFYLVDGPDVAPVKVSRPLTAGMPMASKGSQPTDGGYLLVDEDDYAALAADPIASRFLRTFVQGRDMLNGGRRWCLWMVDADPAELRRSPLLRARLDAVAEARRASPTASVRGQASVPWLFTQIRQPRTRYMALPEVSSSNREWIPARFFEPSEVAGNKLIAWDTDQEWIFAYLQSSAFMAWVRTYGGRLKSDFSISPGLVYFTFPFVIPNAEQQVALETAAQGVLAARAAHPSATLADLYDPVHMPADLRAAHVDLDAVVDGLYGLTAPTEAQRTKVLADRYASLVKR